MCLWACLPLVRLANSNQKANQAHLIVVLDDIVFSANVAESAKSQDLSGILGGAGTYAVLGARLFAAEDTKRVGWVVHTGSDFSTKVREEVDSWNIYTRYISTPERLTTRAKNTYKGELRGFEFLNPKKQVTHDMLDDSLLKARVFHVISNPKRLINLVHGILERIAKGGRDYPHEPDFVWEPMEHSCSPENLPLFLDAMSLAHTFSPNEDEFAKLFGASLSAGEELSADFLREKCELLLQGRAFKVVAVRLGARGVFVAETADKDTASPLICRHFPSYPQAASGYVEGKSRRIQDGIHIPKVVDVTGGGNTFLGAYCMSLVNQPQISNCTIPQSASIAGSVAASFAIEQIGMPKLTMDKEGNEHCEFTYDSKLQHLRYSVAKDSANIDFKGNEESVIGRLETYVQGIGLILRGFAKA